MLSNLVVIVHDKSFKCYKMFRNLPYILMFICQKANCTIREEIQNRMNIWTDYYASSYILAFTYTREGLKRVHWEWGKQTYLLLFQITKGIYMCVWNREKRYRGKQATGLDREKETLNKNGHKKYMFHLLLLIWICKQLLSLSLFPRNGCLSAHYGVSVPTGFIYVWNKGYIKSHLTWKIWCYFKTCLLLFDITNAKQS